MYSKYYGYVKRKGVIQTQNLIVYEKLIRKRNNLIFSKYELCILFSDEKKCKQTKCKMVVSLGGDA